MLALCCACNWYHASEAGQAGLASWLAVGWPALPGSLVGFLAKGLTARLLAAAGFLSGCGRLAGWLAGWLAS